jgi:hypothetical protein
MATKLENEAKKQLKMQEKEQKTAQQAAQKLLKVQEKADKGRVKAEDKAARQLAKLEAKKVDKEAKKTRKAEQTFEKERVKVLLSRPKSEQKPAKLAAKAIAKERNPSLAFKKVQKVRKNFMDLPPALWPLMLVVSYIWAKNTWEKERQQRDLKEARRFLKDTRDIRK